MTPRKSEANEEAFGSTTALAGRLKPDGLPRERERQVAAFEAIGQVSLGAASQIEITNGTVRFLVPFTGALPDEYWLDAFEDARADWPSHLREPRLEEVYGLVFGPLPVGELEEHVEALKERVARTNQRYAQEVVPELRRQHDEARRREEDEQRLQADVEDRLARLLG